MSAASATEWIVVIAPHAEAIRAKTQEHSFIVPQTAIIDRSARHLHIPGKNILKLSRDLVDNILVQAFNRPALG
jgi:hypothetical protein